MKKIEEKLKKIPKWLSSALYQGSLIINKIERNPKTPKQIEERKKYLNKFDLFKKSFYVIESSVKFNCGKPESYIFLNKNGKILMTLTSDKINICWLTSFKQLKFKKEENFYEVPDIKLSLTSYSW